jgi:predicted transcriptional regulator
MKLAKREEQIMQAFWALGRGFIRDVIPHLPDPKPHYNSVATIVKILEDKNFLSHDIVGNTYQYYPIVSKEDYQKYTIKDIVGQYFDNSYPRMLAFFARQQKISEDDMKEILVIIQSNRK